MIMIMIMTWVSLTGLTPAGGTNVCAERIEEVIRFRLGVGSENIGESDPMKINHLSWVEHNSQRRSHCPADYLVSIHSLDYALFSQSLLSEIKKKNSSDTSGASVPCRFVGWLIFGVAWVWLSEWPEAAATCHANSTCSTRRYGICCGLIIQYMVLSSSSLIG